MNLNYDGIELAKPRTKSPPIKTGETMGKKTTAKSEKKANKATTWKTGGKGKKQCPKCKVFVSAKLRQCNCGHDFPIKAKTKVAKQKATNESTAPKQPTATTATNETIESIKAMIDYHRSEIEKLKAQALKMVEAL
jgi:hypothetical protein